MLEREAHALGALLLVADAVDHERLGHGVAHAVARVERFVGILEHDLRLAPERAQRALRERGDVASRDLDRARARHEHAHDRLRRGGLAAARLAHERHELAGGDRQRDAVDGAHHALLLPRERADEPARHRVVDDEVAHVQQRGGAHAAERCQMAGREVGLAHGQQGRAALAAGREAESQRGANGQATSGRSSRGGAPGIDATPAVPVRSGVAANSMRV